MSVDLRGGNKVYNPPILIQKIPQLCENLHFPRGIRLQGNSAWWSRAALAVRLPFTDSERSTGKPSVLRFTERLGQHLQSMCYKGWLRFSFPTFWHYDVLRGLDYLRTAGLKPDTRLREAIETVYHRRHQNGRWPLNLLHSERIPLEMETAVGKASRWNTLRALRVLRWYSNSTASL